MAPPDPPLPELVSGAEIGRRLGVSRARVSQWAHGRTAGFPHPSGRVGPSIVWVWPAVAEWAGRRNGGHRRGPQGGPPAGAAHRPTPSSGLIGRRRELAELSRLLRTGRLLTIAGPAGAGKTRLAEELIRLCPEEQRDGVWLVELASLREPSQLVQQVAHALRLRDLPGRSPGATLLAHLRTRRSLLVLDNCEHLASACAELIASLLDSCPDIAILATTQEPLGLEGETVWSAPPLQVPRPGAGPAAIRASDAVRLFCARARAARPGFAASDDQLSAIAEICRRLDGIPLAIELAAARTGVLTPQEIAERLDRRFDLLSGGEVGLTRHQTLRGALDWTHGLLSEAEQRLLRRLSVFAGGCSLEAITATCTDPGAPSEALLDPLHGLVAKSLVSADTGGSRSRYHMLETVRLHAAERLEEAGEVAALRARHAGWALSLAERAEPELVGADQLTWLDRLDQEAANLRAALGWTIESQDAETALGLAGALALHWRVRSRFAEGRGWLEAGLALDEGADPRRRAKALRGLGFMALMLDDGGAASAALEQSLALDRSLGDLAGQARTLMLLGNARCLTDLPSASTPLAEGATLARQAGDRWCLAHALGLLGRVHLLHGRLGEARQALEECLATARQDGELQGLRLGLYVTGNLSLRQGDLDRAEELLREAVVVTRRLGDPFDIAAALQSLAEVLRLRGDLPAAASLLDQGLELSRQTASPAAIYVALCARGSLALRHGEEAVAGELFAEAEATARSAALPADLAAEGRAELLLQAGDASAARELLDQVVASRRGRGSRLILARALQRLGQLRRASGEPVSAARHHHEAVELLGGVGDVPGLVESLEALGGLAGLERRWEVGACLMGAAAALRERHGLIRWPGEQATFEADRAEAAAALGARFNEVWERGAAMTLAQAVAYAQRGRGARGRPRQGWDSLTRAELNVAGLVAAGLSNPQIAERLFISRSTVQGHLSRIFGKLGVDSRTQLVRESLQREAGRHRKTVELDDVVGAPRQ